MHHPTDRIVPPNSSWWGIKLSWACLMSILWTLKNVSVDPLIYFSFHPVLNNWCTKAHSMYYPVCQMVHRKEPLLLIIKSTCSICMFPISLPEWSFTICPMPYNHNNYVLSVSLNETFSSILFNRRSLSCL